MPLSDHEQRVLEQMEQALYAEDPRLASQLKRSASAGGSTGLDRRRVVLGVLVALGGLALVVVGVMSSMIWIGVVGFLAMVLGGAWAASPTRSGAGRSGQLSVVGKDGTARRPSSTRKDPRTGTFMQRMEQQWDRRREQGP